MSEAEEVIKEAGTEGGEAEEGAAKDTGETPPDKALSEVGAGDREGDEQPPSDTTQPKEEEEKETAAEGQETGGEEKAKVEGDEEGEEGGDDAGGATDTGGDAPEEPSDGQEDTGGVGPEDADPIFTVPTHATPPRPPSPGASSADPVVFSAYPPPRLPDTASTSGLHSDAGAELRYRLSRGVVHREADPVYGQSPPSNIGGESVDFHLNATTLSSNDALAGSDAMTESSCGIDFASLDVGERLYYAGCGAEQRKQAFLRREREHQVLNELSQLASPKITERAHHMDPRSGEAFHRLARERLALRRRELEEEERRKIEEARRGVRINPTSKAIVEHGPMKRRYKGPISGWEAHEAKYQARISGVPVDRDLFRPNINASSLTISRPDPVHHRLHEEAEARRVTREEDMKKSTKDHPPVDPVTGQRLFIPNAARRKAMPKKGSPLDAESSSNDSVVHRLLSKGQEHERKRAQLAAAQKGAVYPFSPQLNERSKQIIADKKCRPTHQDHTATSIQRSPQVHHEQPKKTNPVDAQLRTDAFFTRIDRQLIQKKERISSLQKEREMHEKAECTFQPKISKRSEELFQKRQQTLSPNESDYYSYYSPSRSPPAPCSPPSLVTPKHTSPKRPSDLTDFGVISKYEKEVEAVLQDWAKVQQL